jgi:hypothetical protein
MGINFFFTFPTSEGSDLLSSHVMQTPTFISKLSDGNVIFRLDVGKITIVSAAYFFVLLKLCNYVIQKKIHWIVSVARCCNSKIVIYLTSSCVNWTFFGMSFTRVLI